MKAPIIGVLLIAAGIAMTSAARPVPLSQLAPADEYFGRQRLSVIVIRHKIFALKDDLHHARTDPQNIQHGAEDVQDALLDWSRHFPKDTWLPAAAWNLATLYEELPGPRAQQRAITSLQFVRSSYSGSAFAAYGQRDLARGIGVRPWPRWASDAASLLQAVIAARTVRDARKQQSTLVALEQRFWRNSRSGSDPQYAPCAWELASSYEQLPGADARDRATRLLALLLDRYPSQTYGARALHELERGAGAR